jgi:O-antigen/teichoic acid export membrane protein
MTNSLSFKTLKGVLWHFLEQLLRRTSSTITTLILAWFLVPEDFGLIAMVTVFISLSNVFVQGGIKQALIRMVDITDDDYSTAFIINILLAISVYAVLFACAPLIANFYDSPILIELVRVIGISILFNALSVVQEVKLNRSLNFKFQLKVTLPATLISGGIAVLMAYFNFGLWALVTQVVLLAALKTIFLWFFALWQPVGSFHISSAKQLLGYSGYLVVSQILNVIFRNIYIIVIAKGFSAATVGLYFFAEKIKDILNTQLVDTVQAVMFPALAQIQHDNVKFKESVSRLLVTVTFIVFPILICLCFYAESLFDLLLPDKWLDSARYIQLMCISSLFYPLNVINLSVLKIRGRSDLVLYSGMTNKLLIALILALSYQFGVIAILFGQIISTLICLIVNVCFSNQSLVFNLREQLSCVLPNLILSLLVFGFVAAVIHFLSPHYLIAIFLIMLSSLGYILLARQLSLRGYSELVRLIRMGSRKPA